MRAASGASLMMGTPSVMAARLMAAPTGVNSTREAAERRRDLQLRVAAQVDGKSTGGALFIGDSSQCVAEADSTQSQLKTIQTLRDWR
jgi:hypothetical protein